MKGGNVGESHNGGKRLRKQLNGELLLLNVQDGVGGSVIGLGELQVSQV